MTEDAFTCGLLIIGSGVDVWLPAAMLAAGLGQSVGQVMVCDTGGPQNETLIARPYICEAHNLIGIDDQALAREAKARPRHAYRVDTATGRSAWLPFGEYGLPYQGAAFHQYWLRAWQAGKARPLADYNLALRLNEVAGFLGQAPIGLPLIDYGYEFPEQSYCNLLKRMAANSGVGVIYGKLENADIDTEGSILALTLAGSLFSPELSVFAGPAPQDRAKLVKKIHLSLNGYHIQAPSKLPGLKLHQLQRGTERLLEIWPDKAFAKSEKMELNRLSLAEAERIEDMRALLSGQIDALKNRAELARKAQVYTTRGRIPTEDYEVFSKPEWIAAFSASGYIPKYYDRLVDRLSLDQTLSLVAQTEDRISALLNRSKKSERSV